VNQPAELGRQLERHAAFAPFMDYGGGKYGLAILSRFPIRQVHEVPLPKGNEPRTALAVEVVLPNNQVIMAVNIHFDWVRDDTFRYRQAELLAAYLEGLTMPYVLVGDFNDTPPSRTLQLMRIVSTEAEKQGPQTNTYPADKPSKQIDYLFVGPQARWNILKTEVVDEPVASDHRPVRAALQLLPPTANN
jgi:endonuclease/exonuclease/phosphatase family metal-dependent hydrolase